MQMGPRARVGALRRAVVEITSDDGSGLADDMREAVLAGR